MSSGFNNHPTTAWYALRGGTPQAEGYAKYDALLQGRCRHSRKVANNTYLKRCGNEIAVRLHNTDVVAFRKDGSFAINNGSYNTVTTRDRINQYLPKGFAVWATRNQMFFGTPAGEFAVDHRASVAADGTVESDADIADVKAGWKVEDREQARLARWVRLGQAVKRVTGPECHGKSGWIKRCFECHPYGFRAPRIRPEPGHVCKCGCKFVRQERPKTLTVAKILAEANVTVRMAMIRAYGIERFLIDAGSTTVDSSHGYELIEFVVEKHRYHDDKIVALKMTCPSTHAVYISPVDPACRNVPQAVDWYFNTENYLGLVTQQS